MPVARKKGAWGPQGRARKGRGGERGGGGSCREGVQGTSVLGSVHGRWEGEGGEGEVQGEIATRRQRDFAIFMS